MPSKVPHQIGYGDADKYLTGNPEITYFKSVYNRHTHFALETVEQTFTRYPAYGTRTSFNILRVGDLLLNIYAYVTLPALDTAPYYIYGAANALFRRVELQIGGVTIDTQYSDWLNIWNELVLEEGHVIGNDRMVRNYYNRTQTGELEYYVKFNMWFSQNSALAIPIIKLAFHEVRLSIDFEELENLVANHPGLTSRDNILKCKIFAEYVYLDTPERRYIAQTHGDQLIQQVQYNEFDVPADVAFYNAKLLFYLPVKELIWIHTPLVPSLYGQFDYSYNGTTKHDLHTFTKAKLLINGEELAEERYADYYYLVQNYKYHTRIPRSDMVHITYSDADNSRVYGNYRNLIYTYSFALDPEKWSPSGICNFSKVRSCELQLTYQRTAYAPYNIARKLKVFAISYNILQYSRGMAGLIYSN